MSPKLGLLLSRLGICAMIMNDYPCCSTENPS
jgi:hypothetical protein